MVPLYENFNKLEAVAWFAIAAVLPFRVHMETCRQRLCIGAAVIALVAFGISDLWEASTQGNLPALLWVYKISCATVLLACRYTYLGWETFSIKDRYFVFVLACLSASVLAMFLPRIMTAIVASHFNQ